MLFLGDIAIPFASDASRFGDLPNVSITVANLEGAIHAGPNPSLERCGLFNDVSIGHYLRALNVRAVSLANNHAMDFGQDPTVTSTFLAQHGIASCGCGNNLTEAARDAIVDTKAGRVRLLAFGWKVIGCTTAGNQKPGVNPLERNHILRSIEALRQRSPRDIIVVLPHWNWEFEVYPLPIHRQLARAAVDAGANAVIGSHPHVVQGIEFYRGAPIVYSLGNWMIPQGCFYGGRLVYPDVASLQLAFEWEPGELDAVCHWYIYSRATHVLSYSASETASSSSRIAALTPFRGMSHDQYKYWFRRHRVKKKGLPVYESADAVLGNWVRDRYAAIRQCGVNLTVRAGLKRMGG